MNWKKYRIRFNSEEYVDFLSVTHTTNKNNIENLLEKYKRGEDYKFDLWEENDILNYLTENGIILIPLNTKIEEEFYLPDGDNKEENEKI